MNTLDSVLEKWKKDRDIESLLADGALTNKTAIQDDLDILSDKNRKEAIMALSDIQTVLNKYICDMQNEANSIKAQINTNIKSTQACLSYGSSIDIEKRNKDD